MFFKVLVIGPGEKTKGGITAVIKEYSKTKLWVKYNCKWIETYNNKNKLLKIAYFLRGFFQFLFYLPFCRIVHIHFSWRSSVIRKLPFFLFSRILSKKIIIHLHSGAEPIIQSDIKNIYQYFFNKAHITILLAHAIENQLSKEFSFKKTVIIYNPFKVRSFKKINQKMNIILYAGRLIDKKGIFDLMSAFRDISERYPIWKLQFAGNGNIQKIKKVLKDFKIEDKTEFLGWLNGKQKSEAFEKASIFCLPSYTEGFPMVVLEAWAHGLPVVTTPVGGLPDVLIHGENALVFEPGDITGLARNLEALIKFEELRKQLGKTSVHLVNTHFNIESITKEIDRLYKNMLM